MSRGKRSPKRILKATQENTTNDSLATEREDFWNDERTLAVFHSVIKRKPEGLLKYFIISKIQSQLSDRLKMNVPSKVIWSYLHARWNMNEDDLAKRQIRTFFRTNNKEDFERDFELPHTEEWTRLIEGQFDLIASKIANTGILN
ncbi:unnamed protein product [Macrosiphum euphorbiae]|uniref:Uncharacterized protein n=1 Tax=Macrosiphum euphorbiae TaxID=13131 RepID=A0AAV0XGS1_9HEMI|nr:unnamed protein product [Macrosiphum euphorbiae]